VIAKPVVRVPVAKVAAARSGRALAEFAVEGPEVATVIPAPRAPSRDLGSRRVSTAPDPWTRSGAKEEICSGLRKLF